MTEFGKKRKIVETGENLKPEAGNTDKRGRISTVDLLIKIGHFVTMQKIDEIDIG
jgi:hypothetical protein